MAVTLQLEKMTTSDKLAAMELLWDDLSRDAESVPSPAWHGDVLEAREASVVPRGDQPDLLSYW